MPRKARLRIPGYPLHVLQRGNNRADCFRDRDDFVLYLGLLNDLSPIFECEVHAYALMTNHVHMLVTPHAADSVSNLMKHLGQRYVQHFNRRHSRTGTLWEGRFRSGIVDSELYLFTCHRYIELNPVRAGMVREPWEYPWSSYRTNAGLEPSMVITPHRHYRALGATDAERATNYRALVREPIAEQDLEKIRTSVNSGCVLGSREFVGVVEQSLRRRARPGINGRPRKVSVRVSVPADGKPGSVPGFSEQEDGER